MKWIFHSLVSPIALVVAVSAAKNAQASQGQCAALFGSEQRSVQEQFPFRKFKAELSGKPQVSLARFPGFESFHEVYTSEFELNDGAFEISGAGTGKQVGFRSDESYLHLYQKFPLMKMTETGYITRDEAKMFTNLGANLEQGQINFWRVQRESTSEELKKYPPELLKARKDLSGALRNGHHVVTTASLWSSAGQVLDYQKTAMRLVKLPWEKEEARKGQELDRKKYPFVYEWGRAAQDIAEEIESIYSANAALNYIDLIASGGKLDDAYVMFHSFDKTNSRAYLIGYPNSTYPADWTDVNDMLFLVPLKNMLKRNPPSRFSSILKKIITISENKMSETDALDLLIRVRLLRWQELNLYGRFEQKNPIILNDVSDGRLLGMHVLANHYGLSREKTEKLMDLLVGIVPVTTTHNAYDKYRNAADSLTTSYRYQKYNAVEISNLDPEIAAKDPRYVMSVIFQSYIFYVGQMSKLVQETYGISKAQANVEALNILIKHDVKFGVSTASAEILSQCKKLHPEIEDFQPATSGKRDPDTLKMHPYWFNENHISIFTIPQLLAWARENTAYFTSDAYVINPGYWQRQYLLSQVDLF